MDTSEAQIAGIRQQLKGLDSWDKMSIAFELLSQVSCSTCTKIASIMSIFEEAYNIQPETFEIPKETKIMIIDDSKEHLSLFNRILWEHYAVTVFNNAIKSLTVLQEMHKEWGLPSLILCDINMPEMNGHDFMDVLKGKDEFKEIPVLMMISSDINQHELKSLLNWAVGFINKKVNDEQFWSLVTEKVAKEVRVQIIKQKLNWVISQLQDKLLTVVADLVVKWKQLADINHIMLDEINLLAEYRDNETWMHIKRMSFYSEAIARKMWLTGAECKLILHSSALHDIWKIAISDTILLKPWKLTEEEFDQIKLHTIMWAKMIESLITNLDSAGLDFKMFEMARNIAIYHHEKWNWMGYPWSLKWVMIPIEARISAVSDVFDALTSVRPYKKAWEVEDALAEIKKCSWAHFDPDVVNAFLEIIPEILQIKEKFAEDRVASD